MGGMGDGWGLSLRVCFVTQSGVLSSCKLTQSIFVGLVIILLVEQVEYWEEEVRKGREEMTCSSGWIASQPVYIMDFHSPAPTFPSLLCFPFPPGMLLTSLPSTHS